ncbi:LOW QUALITY PROTEIN: hypothetical protein U9M48_001105 [Paspalum notatum var. saurae]|uniref:Uncharacterized protein n=1 Tax=Paspalum notatum var. saurae TaxID=547442 RepID=A0AAQ3PMT7_PASNO
MADTLYSHRTESLFGDITGASSKTGIICKPLFEALKKDAFQWGPLQTQAFHRLKTVMTTPPVLALPDFDKPFTLEADALGFGIGAVLMQKGKPIAYFSKTLGPRAAAASTYDKESMAILEALKKWKHYFASSSLELISKASNTYKNKDLTPLHQSVLPITVITPTWIQEVQNSYITDERCQQLLTKLTVAPSSFPNYTLRNGLIRYKGKLFIGTAKDLKIQILSTLHASALGGHSGERATYQRIKLLFYWPGMKQDIAAFVKQCPVCQKNKSENTPYPGLLQQLPIPDMAWTHISMDFIEGLPTSNSKNVILVIEILSLLVIFGNLFSELWESNFILALLTILKQMLHSKYYGPFRVLEQIGRAAYKILLPEGCSLHDIFHVSQLKKHLGPKAVPSADLPLIDSKGTIKVAPAALLNRRLIPRNNEPVVQWLIQWLNLPPSEATWEDASFIRKEHHGWVLTLGFLSHHAISLELLKPYPLPHARVLFEEIPQRNRCVVTYNTLITACLRAGDIPTARHLFDEMQRHRRSKRSVVS